MKTVIYHSADYDGIFCCEIAKKFLGEKDVQYIGWTFGDLPIALPINGEFIVMDLPIDKPFGLAFKDGWLMRGDEQLQPLDRMDWQKFTWIDHHKTSIENHPHEIPGYRIDGVAACRLAWQWFSGNHHGTGESYGLPTKEDFVGRNTTRIGVSEPIAVRLAGEYDIWDKRDLNADTFQYGLRIENDGAIQTMLQSDERTEDTIERGKVAQCYAQNVDASICKSRTWLTEWEGLKFLCVNSARFNSLFFAAKDMPETGHDALLGFCFDGKLWTVSLYHAKHRTDIDLSRIAVKYGGGGHRGACGFTCAKLPFLDA